MNLTLKKILGALVVFSLSLVAYYYPLHKKGYTPGGDYLNLIEARNYGQAGTYRYESTDGMFLDSQSVKASGVDTGIANPLTPILYGQLFAQKGFQLNWPIYISILLFAIINVILYLLVARMHSFRAGLIAGLASAFMPVMAISAISPGFYEWGLLFFVLGLWSYFGSRQGIWQASLLRVGMTGIFFTLAALSRNAFAISIGAVVLYDLWVHRSWLRTTIFAVPLILFVLTLTQFSWLGVPNGYSFNTHQPMQQLGHLFNDPYTYYHNKEAFLKVYLNDPAFLTRVDASYAAHLGYHVPLRYRANAYLDSVKTYVTEGLSLTNMGGPIIVAFCCFGLYLLYDKNRRLFWLIVFWLILWLVYLVYARSGNWDHFLEIIFLPLLLISVGLEDLFRHIHGSSLQKRILMIAIVIALSGHLLYATKWRFHDAYQSSTADETLPVVKALKKMPESTMLAMGIHNEAVYRTAYYSNRNIVYFNEDTIQKATPQELKHAFELYHITAFSGYSLEDSIKIEHATGIYPIDL